MRTFDLTLLYKMLSSCTISAADGFGVRLNVRASLAPPHRGRRGFRVSRSEHMLLKNRVSEVGAGLDYNVGLPQALR